MQSRNRALLYLAAIVPFMLVSISHAEAKAIQNLRGKPVRGLTFSKIKTAKTPLNVGTATHPKHGVITLECTGGTKLSCTGKCSALPGLKVRVAEFRKVKTNGWSMSLEIVGSTMMVLLDGLDE